MTLFTDMYIDSKVRTACSFKSMRPKNHRMLFNHQKRSCSGSFIDKSTILQLKGCGLCWTELEIVDPGDSNCLKGDRLVFMTKTILSSFDVDGYDTCDKCQGAGTIHHGFTPTKRKEILMPEEPLKQGEMVTTNVSGGAVGEICGVASNFGPAGIMYIVRLIHRNVSVRGRYELIST